MHLKKLFSVALTLFATIVLMAGTANAQVERAIVRSQVPGAAGLEGFVANDILIDFVGQYTGSQLIVTLESGSVYNNAAFGGNTPPLGALIGVDATVAWDTFVANGGPTVADTVGNFGLGGAAINANRDNPGRAAKFADDGIDQSWNPAGGNVIEDRDDFMVARVTLSNDATGSASFIASANQMLGVSEAVAEGLATGIFGGVPVAGGGGEMHVVLPIANGIIGGGGVVIPEPSTFVLLGISLIGLVALKRRNG